MSAPTPINRSSLVALYPNQYTKFQQTGFNNSMVWSALLYIAPT